MAEDSLLIPAQARRPHGPRSPRRPHSPRGPRCPRCGYDQRGVVATWSESCPLEGTCSECGLAWRWSDAIRGSDWPPWFVERPGERRAIPWLALRTLLMMFRPWQFWSSVQMHHRFRGLRAAAIFLLLGFAIYLTFASGVARRAFVTVRARNVPLTQRYGSALYAALLPWSENPPAWFAGPSVLQLGAARSAVPADYARSCVVFDPDWFRPDMMRTNLVLGELPMSGRRELVDGQLVFSVLVSSIIPLLFIVLRATRRAAHIRPAHLVRIWMYSLAMPVLPLLLKLLDSDHWMGSMIDARRSYLVPVYVVPGLLMLWWSAAIRCYLRLPHPWFMSLLLVIAAWLAAMMLFLGMAAVA